VSIATFAKFGCLLLNTADPDIPSEKARHPITYTRPYDNTEIKQSESIYFHLNQSLQVLRLTGYIFFGKFSQFTFV